MLADGPTMDRDGNALGLKAYPMTDAKTGKPADPYDESNASRFPPWVNAEFLADAVDIRGTITAPLPDAVIERGFHIRPGQDKTTGARRKWQHGDGSSL